MCIGTVINMPQTIVLGHSGFRSVYPENTIIAFEKAIKAGADGIEFDVWLTKDGKLVTLHDGKFRTNGEVQYVKELNLKSLRKFHPYGKFIPTVDEVFERFPNSIFNIDVKDKEAVKPLLKLVEEFDSFDRVIFSSPSPETLRLIREHSKEAKLGFSIVTETGIAKVALLKRNLKLYSLHVPLDGISYVGFPMFIALLKWARGLGVKVFMWNYEMDELFWLPRLKGLYDGIIADNAVKVLNLIELGVL